MKLNCIVVDDDKFMLKAFEALIKKVDFLRHTGSFTRAVDVINEEFEEEPDIIFLDVEMPEITGFELISSLPDKTHVILITSDEKHASEAFEFDVVDFLLKPPKLPRLIKAATKVKKLREKEEREASEGENIFIKTGSGLERVDVSEITYIEALGDYVRVVTPKKKFTIHTTMMSISNKLPDDKFVRVHRSYIVNLNKISGMEDTMVSVNGNTIPVSRSYRPGLIRRMTIL